MSTDDPQPSITDMIREFITTTYGQHAPPEQNTPPQVEPSADLRNIARHLYEQFTAYQQAGFTEQQAFALTATTLTALINPRDQK